MHRCSYFGRIFGACGGGGGNNESPTPVVPPSLGTVKGTAVRSDCGAPIPDAKITLGSATTRSAAGSFTLTNLAVAARATLKVQAAGFADGFGAHL